MMTDLIGISVSAPSRITVGAGWARGLTDSVLIPSASVNTLLTDCNNSRIYEKGVRPTSLVSTRHITEMRVS